MAAPDLGAARAFYSATFGWEFNDYGGGYAGIRASGGDGEVGGPNPSGRVGSGGVLVLLYSDDLDATVAQVKDAGGTIAQEPYEFPGGRRFHLRDPAGKELGVGDRLTWRPRRLNSPPTCPPHDCAAAGADRTASRGSSRTGRYIRADTTDAFKAAIGYRTERGRR
jgi:predicted enzyme related to lactoylglutathione lyase